MSLPMQKWLFCGVILVLALAAGVVVFMLQAAELPNKNNNGFVRDVKKEFRVPTFERNLGENVITISGNTSKCIYMSGGSPEWVLRLDYQLNVIDTLGYGISYNENLRDPGIYVDSPYLYMYATGIAYLLKGKVDSSKIDTLKLKSELITRTAQISNKRLAIRAIDNSQTRQVFQILDCENGEILKEALLIDNQQYGGFETDGFLNYDKISQRLIFVQMFQNKMFCLDSNLNLIYTSNTIDTTYTNSVNIGLLNDGGSTKVMSTKPRTIVNQLVDVYNNRIFVMSGLRADNEGMREFNKYSPIDIYDVSNGKYVGSIRLVKLNGKRIRDFKVTDAHIIALYDGGTCAVFPVDE